MIWNLDKLAKAQTKNWEPQTDVETNQGPESMMPGELRALQRPAHPGTEPGFVNPYSYNHYGPIVIPTVAGIQILPGNARRCYLMIQNQGPGNVWLGFNRQCGTGGDGIQLFSGQALEHIGGGFIVVNAGIGRSIPQCFVSSDFIWAISDNAATIMCAGEGIARHPV
jgi:hypothetical protein